MTTSLDLLTLALLPGLDGRARRELRARGVAQVLGQSGAHADRLPRAALEALASGQARRDAERHLRAADGVRARVCGLDEPDYPAWLARSFDPPLVLFVLGRLVPDEGATSVAIVGARAASPAGLALARSLGADLAAAGATVVSGLARGVDGAAHRGALEARGRTVAVLGSGLARPYPPEHASLAEAIVAGGGAVVSEFPPEAAPLPRNFPQRNRVIAGWGRALVVVEAGSRSGALGTARAALDEGRDVMAVPGHPSEPGCEGSNRLLRDGAVLVRDAADVAEELGLSLRQQASTAGADPVLHLLRRDAPASLDELVARSGQPPQALAARLAELELLERVRRLPGALYVRA